MEKEYGTLGGSLQNLRLLAASRNSAEKENLSSVSYRKRWSNDDDNKNTINNNKNDGGRNRNNSGDDCASTLMTMQNLQKERATLKISQSLAEARSARLLSFLRPGCLFARLCSVRARLFLCNFFCFGRGCLSVRVCVCWFVCLFLSVLCLVSLFLCLYLLCSCHLIIRFQNLFHQNPRVRERVVGESVEEDGSGNGHENH